MKEGSDERERNREAKNFGDCLFVTRRGATFFGQCQVDLLVRAAFREEKALRMFKMCFCFRFSCNMAAWRRVMQ